MKSYNRLKYINAAAVGGMLAGAHLAQAATITVTSAADNVIVDGKVTLREAIISANNNTDINADVTAQGVGSYGNDLIKLNSSSTPTITVVGSLLPVILGNQVIANTGNKVHIVSSAPGNNTRNSIFKVAPGGTATFRNLSINVGAAGICIENTGNNLVVDNCTLEGSAISMWASEGIRDLTAPTVNTVELINTTVSKFGHIGINSGKINLFVKQSTFYNNARGLQNPYGKTTLTNCTFTGNTSYAIDATQNGFRATHCTIAGNTKGFSALSGANITFKNTISTDPNINGFTPTLLGNNILTGNPLLGALANNGGPTWTRLPLAGSPAIDKGVNPMTEPPVLIDQRGYVRPMDNPAIANATGGDGCDIGAVEVMARNKIFINSITQMECDALNTIVYFTVSLLDPATAPVSVSFATADSTATTPGDYVPATGIVSFAPGQKSMAIAIRVYGDATPEPHEEFEVNLSNPLGADIVVGQGIGTIVNDD